MIVKTASDDTDGFSLVAIHRPVVAQDVQDFSFPQREYIAVKEGRTHTGLVYDGTREAGQDSW